MKTLRFKKTAKNIKEYNLFFYLTIGVLTGINISAILTGLFNIPSFVFGVTFGLFLGFSFWVIIKYN